MFQFQGMWLPDGEKHFPEWMAKNGEIVDGRGTYQIKKWRTCLPFIKNWRTAVDVGAHVGFWSVQMAQKFKHVAAFEPMPEFRDCFALNSKSLPYGVVTLIPAALGSSAGRVSMVCNIADTGNTHVAGDGDIEMRTLDSFGYTELDFLKVDCEGYEHNVIAGARETLLRCKPCVIVEQKQHIMAKTYGTSGTPAVDMLRELGAVHRREIGGDHILSWD